MTSAGLSRQLGLRSLTLADRQHLGHGLWWFLYLGGIVAITAIELNLTAQLTVLAIWALVVFPIATSSRLPQLQPMVDMR